MRILGYIALVLLLLVAFGPILNLIASAFCFLMGIPYWTITGLQVFGSIIWTMFVFVFIGLPVLMAFVQS